MDWVYIRHPDIPEDDTVEPGLVSQAAYDEVWAEKGWVIVQWTHPDLLNEGGTI